MKKVLWSAAAALMILTLTGCAGTAGPAPTEDRPPETMVENVPESPAPVEKEQVAFSAGNFPLAEDNEKNEGTDSSTEPVPPAKPAPTPAPQEIPAPKVAEPAFVQQVVTPEPAVQEKAEESHVPTPNVTPEPEITQPPTTPVEPEPPAEPVLPVSSDPPEAAFNIDHWITYAQDYAKDVGLNLDSTAVDCWDNPITAGAHCIYLERDIQSRLNRYAKDDTIQDVWIWAENRSDGSYDLYIGYA